MCVKLVLQCKAVNLCGVYETKNTVNHIVLMSGASAAEAMQSHRFFHATYLGVIRRFMYETKSKCMLMKFIVR